MYIGRLQKHINTKDKSESYFLNIKEYPWNVGVSKAKKSRQFFVKLISS